MRPTHRMTTVFRHNDAFVTKKIGSEYILVRIRDSAAQLDGIYTLGEVGSFIWNLFDGTRPLAKILKMIVKNYEVSSEQAGEDLIDLTVQLEHAGALRRV